MRNLSVFISNLDLDFAQVIELFWFKFYRSNLGIYTIVDRNSCQESLRMLTYRTYVITNTQIFLSDRMAMRRVDGYKKSFKSAYHLKDTKINQSISLQKKTFPKELFVPIQNFFVVQIIHRMN